MRWAVITAQCAPDATDAVSYAFLDAGCPGVVIEGKNPVRVQGSLPVTDELQPKLEALRDHLDRLPEFDLPALLDSLTLTYAEDEDWANAWKQYFKPMRVGRSLIIKPSWESYDPQPGEHILELDPGMAFGTGGHPTTRLCLEALEERVRPGMRVADIGTGSGILAIATARLGANPVLATDIDLLPRRIARENVTRNDLDAVIQILEMADFNSQANDCDLIVANIVANTIIQIADNVAGRVKPDGVFIACGIVEDHHDLVSDALQAAGFELVETKREDIWVCLITRRTAALPDPEAIRDIGRELPPLGADWAL